MECSKVEECFTFPAKMNKQPDSSQARCAGDSERILIWNFADSELNSDPPAVCAVICAARMDEFRKLRWSPFHHRPHYLLYHLPRFWTFISVAAAPHLSITPPVCSAAYLSFTGFLFFSPVSLTPFLASNPVYLEATCRQIGGQMAYMNHTRPFGAQTIGIEVSEER